MITKAVAFYSIFIGISVLAFWLMILYTQEIPEGPLEMTFHLISEIGMAALAILGGVLLSRKRKAGVSLTFISLGMVLYSVLNAAGYYGQKGDTPFLVLFIVLTVLTTAAIGLLVANPRP